MKLGELHTVNATQEEFEAAFHKEPRNRHLSADEQRAVFRHYQHRNGRSVLIRAMNKRAVCVQFNTELFCPAFWFPKDLLV